jgi:tetratricopeptide (TPR) repeat protein
VSKIRFFGMICLSTSMYAQCLDPDLCADERHRQFDPTHAPTDTHSIRLLSASGELSIVEQAPEPSANKPISGIVSLRDLQHPVPKKAIKEAHDAEELARAGNLPKAIAKLEKAIQIHPAYRDAHLNLGVQYARVGRTADARVEFQKALDIGPPAAPIYIDLSLTSLALHQYREAETLAEKALDLDPGNGGAKKVLKYAVEHRF